MSVWNEYHEKLLKKWSSMAKTYSIMHTETSYYYNKWNNRLSVPVILIGAITASSIFTNSGNSVDEFENTLWTYINGSLALIMTGLTGVNTFLGTSDKQTKHTTAAFSYTKISMDIDSVISFPREYRKEDPREFIKSVKLTILEIRKHVPNPPHHIISSYIKRLDKSITNTTTDVNTDIEVQKVVGNVNLGSIKIGTNIPKLISKKTSNSSLNYPIYIHGEEKTLEMADFKDITTNKIMKISDKLECKE